MLNISDDVIIFGKTQADHDKALKVAFQKFTQVNLTLNKMNLTKYFLFWICILKKGYSPDLVKVESIYKALPPTTVRNFLGMAKYCAKFIPNFSDISKPSWKLTRKNQPFLWGKEQEYSFTTIKKLLTSTEIMALDPNKKQS